MIIKVFGMMLVLLSSSLIGIYLGGVDTRRIEDLREVKKAILILKSQIMFMKMPLYESLNSIQDRVKSPIDKIFINTATEIKAFTKRNIDEIFKDNVYKYANQMSLTKDDLKYLASFGECLGFLDLSMQISNIDLMANYIEDKINILKNDSDKNKKMYTSLGILSGLLVCIILI